MITVSACNGPNLEERHAAAIAPSEDDRLLMLQQAQLGATFSALSMRGKSMVSIFETDSQHRGNLKRESRLAAEQLRTF